jgi:hypothetical protein
VAFRAGLPARVLDVARRDYFHGVGSVVPDVPERFWNETLPHHDHGRDDDQEDDPDLEHLIRKLPNLQSTLQAMRESPVNPIGRAVLTRFSAPKTIRPVAPIIWISMSRRLLNIK